MSFSFASEVITSEEISSRVSELGKAIGDDYRNSNPLLLTVMNGAMMFAADLVRAMDTEAEVDFLALNRFGEGGRIRIAMDAMTPLTDRPVIVVEDIVDTGLTLTVLRKMLTDRGPASLATVALFDKTKRRLVDVPIEYRGFEVGDEYLIGYGLDWQGLYRNLPSVWAVLDMEAFVDDRAVLAKSLAEPR